MMGLVFLSLWAVGLMIAGLFSVDPNAPSQKITARISQVNAPLHVLSLAIGAILVSRHFKQDDNWSSLHRRALVLSVFMLALFIVVGFTTVTGSQFAGLGQRIFIATALTWLVLISTRLHFIAIGTVSA
jgi:drug/metabolite transporter superfamily protein YnfA